MASPTYPYQQGGVPMRKTVFEVGAAAAAGLITYMVSNSVGTLNSTLRWGLVILVTLIAFVLSWLAARNKSNAKSDGTKGVRIGNRISAKDDLQIDAIDILPNDEEVAIGEDLRTDGKATLSNISIGRKKNKK